MSFTADNLDRREGAMLAAAIGDALGWPLENRGGRVGGIATVAPRLELVSWRRREGGRYAAHEREIEAGSYSDDTQLILAVGRSLLRGPAWWEQWTRTELPLWLWYERGGGGATKRAARAWCHAHAPWEEGPGGAQPDDYFRAGGNGVAMRVLPHCIAAPEDGGFEPVAAQIFTQGVATHGHPRSLVGALAYGFALWRVLQRAERLAYGELLDLVSDSANVWGALPEPVADLGEWATRADAEHGDYRRLWTRTVDEMLGIVSAAHDGMKQGALSVDRETLDGLGVFDKHSNGAGTVAAGAALFLASRYASQPSQGLTAAAFAKGADTDTIASMTGGLLGAVNGRDWLESIGRPLQDGPYVAALARQLAEGGADTMPPDSAWTVRDQRELDAHLKQRRTDDALVLPVFGDARVETIVDHATKTPNAIRSWLLKTRQGQTLTITKTSKRSVKSDSSNDLPEDSADPVDREGASNSKPSASQEPRIGVIFEVSDVPRLTVFYRDMIGLTIVKESERYVSFGALALEAHDGSTGVSQLSLHEDLYARAADLTLFVDQLDDARLHLKQHRVELSEVRQRQGRRAFRCLDPEAHILEFRERTRAADAAVAGSEPDPDVAGTHGNVVEPAERGQWAVIRDNGQQEIHASRGEAVERGIEVVGSSGGGQLSILREGGEPRDRIVIEVASPPDDSGHSG